MRRYTKHLQTILQTQNIAKHKKFNPHPTKTMEHGKKKDARVHYTVLTQHTHTTTTTHQPRCAIIHSAGQQDNHNHTYAWLLCAAPDTQQHANTLKNNVCESIAPRSATQCICHCGCASTRISKYFSVAVTHSATSTTLSHNRGHNKTKSSLERR